ncbi:hypothetical protein H6789_02065 [Candidatus Nomurabacteria bacterium]|nr:hypothetical protein [Candidatus Nomurabacteria bacterium]
MDTRDILKATDSTRRLVQDDSYYKYIFKKTEKVVSVIFYVSNSVEKGSQTERVIEDVLDTARVAHNQILKTLEIRSHLAEEALRDAAHSLIALDSKLRIASSVGAISAEVLHVLIVEIDGILRGINKYLVRTSAFDDLDYKVSGSPEPTPVHTPRPSTPSKASTPQSSGTSGGTTDSDRRERIKVVLSAKGEATIKDITDIITDVSSKTIQRELNAMIEDNLIKRHGERRWSKYSLT